MVFPYGFPRYSPGILGPEEVREIYNRTRQGINTEVAVDGADPRGQTIPVEDAAINLPGKIVISPFEITPDISRRVPGQLLIFPNTNPPERITNFTAQSGQSQKAILRWTNPPDTDLYALEIYRKEGSYPTGRDDADAELIVTVSENSPGIGLTYEDVGLIDGTTYYYAIYSRDFGMNWNEDTVPGDNAATAISASPSQILNFLASDAESGQVTLTWTNPLDDDLTEISVRRKVGSYPTDELDGTEVLTDTSPVSGGSNSVVDTIAPGTYYYAVFPKNSLGYNQLVTAGRNADTGTSA